MNRSFDGRGVAHQIGRRIRLEAAHQPHDRSVAQQIDEHHHHQHDRDWPGRSLSWLFVAHSLLSITGTAVPPTYNSRTSHACRSSSHCSTDRTRTLRPSTVAAVVRRLLLSPKRFDDVLLVKRHRPPHCPLDGRAGCDVPGLKTLALICWRRYRFNGRCTRRQRRLTCRVNGCQSDGSHSRDDNGPRTEA